MKNNIRYCRMSSHCIPFSTTQESHKKVCKYHLRQHRMSHLTQDLIVLFRQFSIQLKLNKWYQLSLLVTNTLQAGHPLICQCYCQRFINLHKGRFGGVKESLAIDLEPKHTLTAICRHFNTVCFCRCATPLISTAQTPSCFLNMFRSSVSELAKFW